MCKRYGRSPSQVLGIGDEIVGFQFDIAVMVEGVRAENRAEKEARKKDDCTDARARLNQLIKEQEAAERNGDT